MHEVSIALSMLEGIAEEATRRGFTRVKSAYLSVGVLSGVVPDALQFAWSVTTEGTVAEGSQLIIDPVPISIFCRKCENETAPRSSHSFECPSCGTTASEIRRGRELLLTKIEVADAVPSHRDTAQPA